MIELKNIKVVFNAGSPIENVALSEVDLCIREGEFVTIIGGNGAGKSTLMNVLAGAVEPNGGSLLIDEKDMAGVSTQRRAGEVSRVFQNPTTGTCCDLTIEENLALAYSRRRRRRMRPAITTETRNIFRDALKELGIGLEKRLGDPIKMLSGGQRQAVSLVMATLRGSKLLLLDEHTAALDPKMAGTIMELTQKLVSRHKLTALMITHSMHQALEYGSRTVVMQEGQIIKEVEGEERAKLRPEDLLRLFEA